MSIRYFYGNRNMKYSISLLGSLIIEIDIIKFKVPQEVTCLKQKYNLIYNVHFYAYITFISSRHKIWITPFPHQHPFKALQHLSYILSFRNQFTIFKSWRFVVIIFCKIVENNMKLIKLELEKGTNAPMDSARIALVETQ